MVEYYSMSLEMIEYKYIVKTRESCLAIDASFWE